MPDFIVQSVTRLLLPLIQMYGLYVIFHGHLSPGGGFAGGVIFGLALVLYGLVFGLEKQRVTHRVTEMVESLGTLWYGAIGLVGVVRGASFLVNREIAPLGRPGALLSSGTILLITCGVGLKVASTFLTLFTTLAEEESP